MKQYLIGLCFLTLGCGQSEIIPLSSEEIRAKTDKCEELRLHPRPLFNLGGQIWDIVCTPDVYLDRG